MSATNHLSWENQGVHQAPIHVDFSDTSEPKFPDLYAIIDPVELENNPVFEPISNSQLQLSYNLVQWAKIKDESWMIHVARLLQHDTLPEVITWPGYNSQITRDDSLTP